MESAFQGGMDPSQFRSHCILVPDSMTPNMRLGPLSFEDFMNHASFGSGKDYSSLDECKCQELLELVELDQRIQQHSEPLGDLSNGERRRMYLLYALYAAASKKNVILLQTLAFPLPSLSES